MAARQGRTHVPCRGSDDELPDTGDHRADSEAEVEDMTEVDAPWLSQRVLPLAK
jgi:hypothetical protein